MYLGEGVFYTLCQIHGDYKLDVMNSYSITELDSLLFHR